MEFDFNQIQSGDDRFLEQSLYRQIHNSGKIKIKGILGLYSTAGSIVDDTFLYQHDIFQHFLQTTIVDKQSQNKARDRNTAEKRSLQYATICVLLEVSGGVLFVFLFSNRTK